jgi:hypothetical protein
MRHLQSCFSNYTLPHVIDLEKHYTGCSINNLLCDFYSPIICPEGSLRDRGLPRIS